MSKRDENTDSSRTGPGPSRESKMREIDPMLTGPWSPWDDKQVNGGMSDTRGADDIPGFDKN